MLNLDIDTSENDNKSWPYTVLVVGPCGSEKRTLSSRFICMRKS